ncbi:MAG: TolC family protein [Armatimonadota bacterium]|nr:TolC family protein [Armatimonadota bacterium]
MITGRCLALALIVALAVPAATRAQPAPRRLSFGELAAVVAERNLTLRAAAFDVAVARTQLAQAKGERLPQLSLTGSYGTGQQRPGTTTTISNPFGPGTITLTVPGPDPSQVLLRVGLQYPLYSGGRIEAQIALAEANLKGAQAVFARTTQQVVFSAQQAYLRALLARENLTASRRTLEEAEESLRVAQERVRAGVAAGFDELQAEVQVARARQGIVQAMAGVRNADIALNALLNERLDGALMLTDTLEPRPVTGTQDAAIAAALRQRPELAESAARIEATRASIALAASGGRPTITLGGGYDVSGTPSANAGAWSATLSATLLLFNGGITRERIREAELRLEQLAVQEARTRQQVELEVRQAWIALEQAAAELVVAAKAVEQAREAARIAVVRYDAGLGTVLEVLSAQATLAQTEFSLASARFNQNLARVQLVLAIGGTL